MPAPTPDARPFDWLTAVPWFVAIVGTVVNLLWNFSNYRITTGLQRRIRRETIALEEFRRVRVPIDAALGDLTNQKATLISLSGSGVAIEEWRTQVGTAQIAIGSAWERLESALARADQSGFAHGEDWLRPIEAIWDDFSTAMNGAYNPTKKEADARLVPAQAADRLQGIVSAVERRIDRELKTYGL